MVRNGRIFINYRRDDSRADAGRIYDHLNTCFPGRVFQDISSLAPGVEWENAIGQVLSQADVCVVVIGCNWLNVKGSDGRPRLADSRDTLRREIVTALQQRMHVIPVLVGGAKMPDAHYLPADLRALCNHNALEMVEQNWTECCNRLISALEAALGISRAGAATRKTNRKWVWALVITAVLIMAVIRQSLSNHDSNNKTPTTQSNLAQQIPPPQNNQQKTQPVNPLPQNPPPENMLRYTARSFSIDRPHNWIVFHESDNAVDFCLDGETRRTPDGNGWCNYAVSVKFLPAAGPLDLQTATHTMALRLMSQNPGTVITKGPEPHQGVGLVTTFVGPTPYNYNETDVMITIARPNGLAILMFGAPLEQFQRWVPVFDQFLDTLTYR